MEDATRFLRDHKPHQDIHGNCRLVRADSNNMEPDHPQYFSSYNTELPNDRSSCLQGDYPCSKIVQGIGESSLS